MQAKPFILLIDDETAITNNPDATTTSAVIPTETIATPTQTIPVLLPTNEAPAEITAPAAPQMVQVYLIAIEDNGQSVIPVGCGDSAVPIQVQVEPTEGVLKAAVEALLSIKEQYYGQSGLYDALFQSDLLVDSVNITDGKAEVYLSGSMILGGECDNPRVQAQIGQTILQLSTITEVSVYINGKTLADALSLKGN